MGTAIAVIEDNNHSSTYTGAENLARQVLARMASMTAKLKDLEDDIRKLWVEFDNLKAGETILGCATKAEFCEKKLHRTPQAVRYMLNPELRQSKQCLLPESSEAPQKAFLPDTLYADVSLCLSHEKLSESETIQQLCHAPNSDYVGQEHAVRRAIDLYKREGEKAHRRTIAHLGDARQIIVDADIETAILDLAEKDKDGSKVHLYEAASNPVVSTPVKTSDKPASESQTKKLQRQFEAISNPAIGKITLKPSNVSSGVETSMGRYDLVLSGVTKPMLEKIRQVLAC
jgi:hypothetical protein